MEGYNLMREKPGPASPREVIPRGSSFTDKINEEAEQQ